MTAVDSPSRQEASMPVEVRRNRPIAARLNVFIVPAAILVVWQGASFLLTDSAVASPYSTALAFVDGVQRGWLTANLWATFEVVLRALALGGIAGIAVGLWLGTSKFWGDVLGAPLVWIYSLPKVVVFPVFLLVLGLGDASRVGFGALHGFFPLAIIVTAGIQAIPAVYLRTARVLNLGWWRTMTGVIVPAALPSILTGLRFCFSLCFLGVILAEMFGSQKGAGYELMRRISLNALPEIFAIAITLTLAALLINAILIVIEKRVTRRAGEAGHAVR